MQRIIATILAFIVAAAFFQAAAQDNGEVVTGNEVGNYIGDFEAKGPYGEMLKLSDLKGDLVLVILWNSLCGHCNVENKKYQEAYEAYHGKEFINGNDFEIYQIALDKEEATWHEALEKYDFPWDNHVYVIDSWRDKNIRFFGVKNLPGTFLIDENGMILAKKFGGEELPEILERYVKK